MILVRITKAIAKLDICRLGSPEESPVAYYLTLVANLSIIMLESKLLYLVTLETLRMCPNLITQLLVATTTC